MLDTMYFENLLKQRELIENDARTKWNLRAKHFSHTQRNTFSEIPKKVTELMLAKGILQGGTVLDIGGGTGRYAIPFSSHAQKVVLTDVAENMLEYAEKNAWEAGVKNMEYRLLDWESADIDSLGLEKSFDLVFASMCPAIRSKKGLEKMIKVSKGWCWINQFIETKDSGDDIIRKALNLEKEKGPHDDRDGVQGFFNLLWLMGYEPEISYIRDKKSMEYSLDDAAERYEGRFGEEAIKAGLNIKDIFSSHSQEGNIEIKRSETLALIYWKI